MATTLEEKLIPEDQEIQTVCADLALAPSSTDIRRLVGEKKGIPDRRGSQKVISTMQAEVVTGLDSLFSLLEVPRQSCNAERLIANDLLGTPADETSCVNEIEAALANARKGEASGKRRIAAALEKSGFSSGVMIVADPVRAARLIDLSPALVAASLELSASAERLADQIAGSFSWAQGLVRAALTLAAAETVAWTFDHVVDALEQRKLVNPATIARAACELRGTSTIGLVGTRVLKRAILRMDPTQWDKKAYPMQSLCEEIRDPELCSELREKAATSSVDPERRRPLAPTLARSFDWEASAAEVVKRTTAVINDATNLCQLPIVENGDGGTSVRYVDTPCDFHFLNRVASVLLLYDINATAQNREAIERHVRELRVHLDQRLTAIDDRVKSLQSDLVNTKTALSDLARDSDLERKSYEMLSRLLDCSDARAKARFARFKFAAEAMDICSSPSAEHQSLCNLVPKMDIGGMDLYCEGDPADTISAKLPNGGTLSVERSALCDVSARELQVDLQTDHAFDPCGTEIKPAGVADISAVFTRKAFHTAPTEIMIVGHADEQALGEDCTRRIGSDGEGGNLRLSIQRARRVYDLLRGMTDAGQTALSLRAPNGVGSSEPALGSRGCAQRPTQKEQRECHARNRRVTFRISRPSEFEFAVVDCRQLNKRPPPPPVDAGARKAH